MSGGSRAAKAPVVCSARLLLALALISCAAVPAIAQINSDQMRQRYDKSTKGGSIDDFVKKLNSNDADARLEAVKSLGASKDAKAIAYLIAALGDPDMRVQAKTVDILGELRATDASPVLIQYLFLRSSDYKLKQRILASLGKIGDQRSARPIVEFLHRDLDPETRGTAIFALGEIGSPDALEALGHISVEDENPSVRRLAGEAASKVQAHQEVRRKEVKGPSETFLEPKAPPPQE